MIPEKWGPTPTASDSKETAKAIAESSCGDIKLLAESNQSCNLKFFVRWFGKQNVKSFFQSLWFDKFTSADMQGEMLEIMALRVLQERAQNIQNAVNYTIMADESAEV